MTSARLVTAVALAISLGTAQALPPPFNPIEQLNAAVAALMPSAQAGDADAQSQLAQVFMNASQVSEALDWYRRAAAQGHEEATLRLAEELWKHSGDGGVREAADWLRRAAERGSLKAKVALGNLLMGGPITLANPKEAVAWYRDAAEQGYVPGQWSLGLALRDGRGAGRDERQAFEWFQKGAQQGDFLSRLFMAGMMQEGRGVAQDESAAAALYLQLAREPAGPELVAYEVGRCFELGRGVHQDFGEAARWYETAARAGDARGKRNLALLLQAGKGRTQDLVQAHAWLLSALSGMTGFMFDKQEAEAIAAMLTPEQLAESHRLARQWRLGEPMRPPAVGKAVER